MSTARQILIRGDRYPGHVQPAELSSSTQDYLKTIWQLGEWSPDKVTTTTLAARMGLAASTVSEALKKLTAQGMVTRPSYGVVELTDEGRSVAVTMVRRHRLLETFLTTKLGYAWDEVHDEAEVLEHAVSEKFLDRIDALLGHPAADPHGDVIPSPSGVIAAPTAVQLVDVLDPVAVDVVRVSDDDPATLRYLAGVGVVPGTRLRVLPDSGSPGMIAVSVEAAASDGAGSLGRAAAGGACCTGPRDAASTFADPQSVVSMGVLAAEAVWVTRV